MASKGMIRAGGSETFYIHLFVVTCFQTWKSNWTTSATSSRWQYTEPRTAWNSGAAANNLCMSQPTVSKGLIGWGVGGAIYTPTTWRNSLVPTKSCIRSLKEGGWPHPPTYQGCSHKKGWKDLMVSSKKLTRCFAGECSHTVTQSLKKTSTVVHQQSPCRISSTHREQCYMVTSSNMTQEQPIPIAAQHTLPMGQSDKTTMQIVHPWMTC